MYLKMGLKTKKEDPLYLEFGQAWPIFFPGRAPLLPPRGLRPIQLTPLLSPPHPSPADRPGPPVISLLSPTASFSHAQKAATDADLPRSPLPTLSPVLRSFWMRPSQCCSPLLPIRSEEHTSELQSPECISYAVFCLKKKTVTTVKNRWFLIEFL